MGRRQTRSPARSAASQTRAQRASSLATAAVAACPMATVAAPPRDDPCLPPIARLFLRGWPPGAEGVPFPTRGGVGRPPPPLAPARDPRGRPRWPWGHPLKEFLPAGADLFRTQHLDLQLV